MIVSCRIHQSLIIAMYNVFNLPTPIVLNSGHKIPWLTYGYKLTEATKPNQSDHQSVPGNVKVVLSLKPLCLWSMDIL